MQIQCTTRWVLAQLNQNQSFAPKPGHRNSVPISTKEPGSASHGPGRPARALLRTGPFPSSRGRAASSTPSKTHIPQLHRLQFPVPSSSTTVSVGQKWQKNKTVHKAAVPSTSLVPAQAVSLTVPFQSFLPTLTGPKSTQHTDIFTVPKHWHLSPAFFFLFFFFNNP